MSKASSILSFCGKIKRKWKSSSCKTFDKFNLWLGLILWPYSPSERCRKPVQELAQDQFIRNLPRWRPLWVDFSLFSHRFPTWKMHSTPGCTWKMQLMQKTPKNRSFEEIITSQSNRPTQIFWPWILPASPCIFLLIQNFLRPFLYVRVYSFQSRPSLIQMKWL